MNDIFSGLFFIADGTGGTFGIASVISSILSPEQKWFTGQVFQVDGGLSTVQAR